MILPLQTGAGFIRRGRCTPGQIGRYAAQCRNNNSLLFCETHRAKEWVTTICNGHPSSNYLQTTSAWGYCPAALSTSLISTLGTAIALVEQAVTGCMSLLRSLASSASKQAASFCLIAATWGTL